MPSNKDYKKRKSSINLTPVEVWNRMTENEKAGVRFGLFPIWTEKMSHEDIVALMNIAEKEKGAL